MAASWDDESQYLSVDEMNEPDNGTLQSSHTKPYADSISCSDASVASTNTSDLFSATPSLYPGRNQASSSHHYDFDSDSASLEVAKNPWSRNTTSLVEAVTTDPELLAGDISEPTWNVEEWVAQSRVAQDRMAPTSECSDLISSCTSAPSEASSSSLPISRSTSSSPRRPPQRLKAQLASDLPKSYCDVCGTGFRKKGDLKHHQRSHMPYELRPHWCDICDWRFLYPRELRRHYNVHLKKVSSGYAVTCKHCTKVYSRRDNLDRHIRSQHAIERPRSSLSASQARRQLDSEPLPASETSGSRPNAVTTGNPELENHCHTADDDDPTSALAEDLSVQVAAHPGLNSTSVGASHSGIDMSHLQHEEKQSVAYGRPQTFRTKTTSVSNTTTNSDPSSHSTTLNNDGVPDARLHDESPATPAETTSELSTHSSSPASSESFAILDWEECRCPPEECHANTCPPAEFDRGQPLDIHKLIALLARPGADQTSHMYAGNRDESTAGTANCSDGDSRRSRKRARATGRDDGNDENGESGRQRRPRFGDIVSSKGKPLFRCPVGAGCWIQNIGFRCSCCEWYGTDQFCHIRIHIWREHVANQETGEFKQYTGHSYIAGSFHELDAELQRHQHESPNKKWHRTYRYLHQDRDPSDEPHHFVDPASVQRTLEQIVTHNNQIAQLMHELAQARHELVQTTTERNAFHQMIVSSSVRRINPPRTHESSMPRTPNRLQVAGSSGGPINYYAPSQQDTQSATRNQGGSGSTHATPEAAGVGMSWASSSWASSHGRERLSSFNWQSSDAQSPAEPSFSATSLSSDLSHLGDIAPSQTHTVPGDRASLLNYIGEQHTQAFATAPRARQGHPMGYPRLDVDVERETARDESDESDR